MNPILDNPDQLSALLPRVKLPPKVRELLKPETTLRQSMQTLQQTELYLEAIRLLATALDRRVGVWWACSCVRQGLTDEELPAEIAALDAAEQWVIEPTDANRRTAGAAAEVVDYGTPAGCAAMAAVWAEGSLSAPGMPDVKAPEHLHPGAVSNAVLMAAVRREPEKAVKRFQQFIAIGIDIAEGKNRWKDPSAAGSPSQERFTPPRSATPKPGTRPPVPRRP